MLCLIAYLLAPIQGWRHHQVWPEQPPVPVLWPRGAAPRGGAYKEPEGSAGTAGVRGAHEGARQEGEWLNWSVAGMWLLAAGVHGAQEGARQEGGL